MPFCSRPRAQPRGSSVFFPVIPSYQLIRRSSTESSDPPGEERRAKAPRILPAFFKEWFLFPLSRTYVKNNFFYCNSWSSIKKAFLSHPSWGPSCISRSNQVTSRATMNIHAPIKWLWLLSLLIRWVLALPSLSFDAVFFSLHQILVRFFPFTFSGSKKQSKCPNKFRRSKISCWRLEGRMPSRSRSRRTEPTPSSRYDDHLTVLTSLLSSSCLFSFTRNFLVYDSSHLSSLIWPDYFTPS